MDVDNPLIYEFHFRDERGQNKIFVTKRGALKILCWTDWRQNLLFKKVWPHYFPSLCLMCVLFYLPWIEEAVCGGKPVSTGPAAWRVVCTEWVAQDWEMADGRCLPKFNFPLPYIWASPATVAFSEVPEAPGCFYTRIFIYAGPSLLMGQSPAYSLWSQLMPLFLLI